MKILFKGIFLLCMFLMIGACGSNSPNTNDKETNMEPAISPTEDTPVEEVAIHVNSAKRGEYEIHRAAKKGKLDEVKKFLKEGVDINLPDGINWTPLHLAINAEQAEVAKYLIQEGADIFIKIKNDKTALHLAFWTGQEELVLILLEQGADINAKDNLGETPLDYAKEAGHTDIYSLLTK